MKKILNGCLLISSLFGYLEWADKHAFLGMVEYDLLFDSKNRTGSLTHPFVLVPLIGQLLLLITLFQKTPNKAITITGLICLSLIMLMLFLIGIMGMNLKMVLASLPFIILAILVIKHNRKKKKVNTEAA